MPLKAKVRFPKISIAKTQARIHEAMVQAVTDACKTWVIATTDAVPVLTGASKASFLRLAFAARVTLTINPRVTSRIPLGIATSTGQLIVQKGSRYGFEWTSGLDYIHIVDRYDGFLDAGDAALAAFTQQVVLPAPTIQRSGGG